MKILWLSHLVPYPPKGGVLQRSYNLVREISKYHEVTVLAFIQSDLIKSRLSNMESGLEEAYQHLNEYCELVKFIEIPCEKTKYGKNLLALKSLFTITPYTVNWLKSDQMLSAIRKLNEEIEFDLVHFDTISLAPYISEFSNIPKVLDHHNIESHMMLRRAEQEKNPLKLMYFYQEGLKLLLYEKKVCKNFNLHLTCSSIDAARLLELDSTLSITEIPNGVDVDYFYPQPKNQIDQHLIFAGSLNWYPNRDAMVYFARNIWPLLKQASPDITMNIVGSSPPAELLEMAAKDNNFRVHGFVDDVRDYISRAEIYVCPIRDGGGTKLKILDSFAMGMATVAHPIACEGLLATDGENILMASDPEEFVDKIIYLIKNNNIRKQLGENARKIAIEEYAYTSIGEKLSNKYLKIIDTLK